ncbi:hypothetical protein K1719_016749 [Acacia pycnantha]|nr:hypothetical protein K1719_016749 [Acacia pycnantha]
MLVSISTPDGPSGTVMKREETDHLVQKEVQRFCFVRILPKDCVDARSLVQNAINLFEEKDQRLLQISESITLRLNDREDAVSRLQRLKREDFSEFKRSIAREKDLLTQLYMALDELSFPKCSSQEKLQKHVVCDELMEMRKEKKGLEAKIKVAEKEFEAINEEIWLFQEHLKGNHQRKEASLFFLKTMEIDNYWCLKYGNLDYNSIHFNTVFAEIVNGVVKILLSAAFPY